MIAQNKKIYAGFSRVEITPPIGYPVYYKGISTKILDSLFVKSMVLAQDRTKLAILFCDLFGTSIDLVSAVRENLAAGIDFPVENILFISTHTHSGPIYTHTGKSYFSQGRYPLGRINGEETIPIEKKYSKELINKMAKSVRDANANLSTIRLQSGTCQCPGLTFNRRYHMKDGSVQFNPGFQNPDIIKPACPVDNQLNFLMLRDFNNDKPIAMISNFALQAFTYGKPQFTADFPHFYEKAMQEKFGHDFLSLWTVAPSAEINQFDVSKPGPQIDYNNVTKKIGNTLASAVSANLENLKDINTPHLEIKRNVFNAKLQSFTKEQLINAQKFIKQNDEWSLNLVEAQKILDLEKFHIQGDKFPQEIYAIQFDNDTAMITLPALVFTAFGLDFRKKSPFQTIFPVELTNSYEAMYIPTKQAHKEGSYEIINSRLKPGEGEKMVDNLMEMLAEFKTSFKNN